MACARSVILPVFFVWARPQLPSKTQKVENVSQPNSKGKFCFNKSATESTNKYLNSKQNYLNKERRTHVFYCAIQTVNFYPVLSHYTLQMLFYLINFMLTNNTCRCLRPYISSFSSMKCSCLCLCSIFYLLYWQNSNFTVVLEILCARAAQRKAELWNGRKKMCRFSLTKTGSPNTKKEAYIWVKEKATVNFKMVVWHL